MTIVNPLPVINNTKFLTVERFGPRVHTINNQNPYQGIPIAKGHGKYPVIFEPLQNVQTSGSTFKVTSFIDFTPYLKYFSNFERYLAAFKQGVDSLEQDPVMSEFWQKTYKAANSEGKWECTNYTYCFAQPLLFKPAHNRARAPAMHRQMAQCKARQMQALPFAVTV